MQSPPPPPQGPLQPDGQWPTYPQSPNGPRFSGPIQGGSQSTYPSPPYPPMNQPMMGQQPPFSRPAGPYSQRPAPMNVARWWRGATNGKRFGLATALAIPLSCMVCGIFSSAASSANAQNRSLTNNGNTALQSTATSSAPTPTFGPTNTPAPTDTPAPTATRAPTATPYPNAVPPQPKVVFDQSGDQPNRSAAFKVDAGWESITLDWSCDLSTSPFGSIYNVSADFYTTDGQDLGNVLNELCEQGNTSGSVNISYDNSGIDIVGGGYFKLDIFATGWYHIKIIE